MYMYMYMYMYICIHRERVCVCIYIYIEREREICTHTCMVTWEIWSKISAIRQSEGKCYKPDTIQST